MSGGFRLMSIFTRLVVVLVVGTTLLLAGCGGYGKVSDTAYEVATAVYSACLAESEARIDRVEDLLDDEAFVEQMSDEEVQWLRSIIAKARDGKWQAAAKKARRMMEDQVSM